VRTAERHRGFIGSRGGDKRFLQVEFGTGDNILHFGGSGPYQWNVDKTNANQIFSSAWANGVQQVFPGSAGIDFFYEDQAPTSYTLGTPLEEEHTSDSVTLRGWVNQGEKLWYILFLKVYAGTPYARGVLSIMDKRTDRAHYLAPYNAVDVSVGSAVITLPGFNQGLLVGDRVRVDRAGTAGAHLYGTILSKTSTTITLDVNVANVDSTTGNQHIAGDAPGWSKVDGIADTSKFYRFDYVVLNNDGVIRQIQDVPTATSFNVAPAVGSNTNGVAIKRRTYVEQWLPRRVQNFKVRVGTAAGGTPQTITHRHPWGYDNGSEPYSEMYAVTGQDGVFNWYDRGYNTGTPEYDILDPDPNLVQAAHWCATGNYLNGVSYDQNRIEFVPRFVGTAVIKLKYTGHTTSTERGSGVRLKVVQSGGGVFEENSLVQAAGAQVYALNSGTALALDANSKAIVCAHGSGKVAVSGVRIEPTSAPAFEIPLRRHNGVFDDGQPVKFAVRDFWQRSPARLVRTSTLMGWDGVLNHAPLFGGEGYSVEFMVAIDGTAAELKAKFEEKPTLTAPAIIPPFEYAAQAGNLGSLVQGWYGDLNDWRKKENLKSNNYGKTWGNYKDEDGMYTYPVPYGVFPVQQAFYNDQAHGLLALIEAAVRTDSQDAWNTLLSVAYQRLDHCLIKFAPFGGEGGAGGAFRKGSFNFSPRGSQPVETEVLVETAYDALPFLWLWQLTGNTIFRDAGLMSVQCCAHQVDHNVTFAAQTAGKLDNCIERALRAGKYFFPTDTYFAETNTRTYKDFLQVFINKLMQDRVTTGRLIGKQPVWRAGKIRGLCVWHYEHGATTLATSGGPYTAAQIAAAIIGEVKTLATSCIRVNASDPSHYDFMYTDGSTDINGTDPVTWAGAGPLVYPDSQSRGAGFYGLQWLGVAGYAWSIASGADKTTIFDLLNKLKAYYTTWISRATFVHDLTHLNDVAAFQNFAGAAF